MFAVRQVCEKYLTNEKDVSGRLWIWKRPMILSIDIWCVTDSKSVWSLRKIVESSAEFLCR